jgi:hypothetical protein
MVYRCENTQVRSFYHNGTQVKASFLFEAFGKASDGSGSDSGGGVRK